MANDKLVNKKSWSEFRSTGLLLIINQVLHVFGWAICFDIDDNGNIKSVFPARVRFRGFVEDAVSDAYIKASNYLKDNIDDLVKEASE